MLQAIKDDNSFELLRLINDNARNQNKTRGQILDSMRPSLLEMAVNECSVAGPRSIATDRCTGERTDTSRTRTKAEGVNFPGFFARG